MIFRWSTDIAWCREDRRGLLLACTVLGIARIIVGNMDSYRYLNRVTRTVVKAWIRREVPRQIPWTPLRKPLSQCTVSLVSSAAVAMRTDRPFDQDKERRDPWHPDESYRLIPRQATEQDVHLYHLHINTNFGEQDLDCVMPLGRLRKLEEPGRGTDARMLYAAGDYACEEKRGLLCPP